MLFMKSSHPVEMSSVDDSSLSPPAEVDAVWAVAVAGVEAPSEAEEPIVPGLA